ncbi:MFS family permease [Leucobacter exalbidus]|uniref:MFS family permease n=1 Tax=Leucobacter exalbidus TaxID=662960 RepID=A0A940PQT9_9MICO|nr:MFS family permease [Leucobacter exalbidus]
MAGVIANVAFIAVILAWGKLSDRIGRRPVLLIGGIGAAVMYFPATWMIQGSIWSLAGAMIVMLIFVGALAAVTPAVFPELFPTSLRTMGVAIPYSLCVAVFGGTAAYLQAGFAAWFGDAGPTVFGLYAVLLLIVGAFTAYTLRETKGIDLHPTASVETVAPASATK